MTGRIGMDAIQQQMLIGPVSGPRGEEINIGDRFCGRSLLNRCVEHRDGGIPVRPLGHPGNRSGAGVIHWCEPDPADEGRTRTGTLNERPDISADVRRCCYRPAMYELVFH
jgi:hypothetical protein